MPLLKTFFASGPCFFHMHFEGQVTYRTIWELQVTFWAIWGLQVDMCARVCEKFAHHVSLWQIMFNLLTYWCFYCANHGGRPRDIDFFDKYNQTFGLSCRRYHFFVLLPLSVFFLCDILFLCDTVFFFLHNCFSLQNWNTRCKNSLLFAPFARVQNWALIEMDILLRVFSP